tara:strand:+ start:4348 stop:5082 length:735 start_codon:yes stop_codon:yes gene_type:complete
MNAEILEQLKNDDEYYNGLGRQFLSNSDIGALLKNPKEFGVKRKDSKEFAMGRYFHQLFLEPDKAKKVKHIDVSSRATKKYKESLAEIQKELILLTKEKEEVELWVDTMKTNFDFFNYINNEKNKYEVPAVTELCGELWKGKADIVGEDFLFDLKTTSNINDFRWNFRKYNYDSQAYIYSSLFKKPMMFLVLDKTSLMMGAYTVSQESLDRGKDKVERAVEVYQKFYGDNPTEDINQYYFYEEI